MGRYAAILVFIALAIAGCTGTDARLTPTCRTSLCCPDCQRMSVSRVIDGDTFVGPGGHVRLFGVDAPEQGERCSAEATHRLEELAGKSVRVERGPRLTDSHGRLLYYVYTAAGGSIDEMLVREGLARAWRRDGQHRDVLVDLEGKAQRDGRGCLWRVGTE